MKVEKAQRQTLKALCCPQGPRTPSPTCLDCQLPWPQLNLTKGDLILVQRWGVGRGWRQLETKTTTTNFTLNTMLGIGHLQPGDLSPNNSTLKTELVLNTRGLPVVRCAHPCNLMTGETTRESVWQVHSALTGHSTRNGEIFRTTGVLAKDCSN